MRKILTILLAAVGFVSIEARTTASLNFGWLYHQGDAVGAEAVGYDDSGWQKVDLPHDASIYGDFVKAEGKPALWYGFRPRHRGWYRKSLTVTGGNLRFDDMQEPVAISGKRVALDFEGVYRLATVYVNGKRCSGPHANGYLDFGCDITAALREGRNVVAVSYDNTDLRSSRWYSGEGIDRNVWLTVTDDLHVARCGPSVTTDGDCAKVETLVSNDAADSVSCKLVTAVVDASGRQVASDSAVALFGAHETFSFRQQLRVADARQWNVGAPYLYTLVSRVYRGGKLTDEVTTDFGFRKVEFSATRGLLVNGRKVFLKGVCLHTDLGPLGTASLDAGWDRRLAAVVDSMGCNALRLSHNCYPRYVLDWCDRHGVLVFDEFTDKWDGSLYGEGAVFGSHLMTDLTRQIERDRNHPSVFVWSVGNEVYEQYIADSLCRGGVERLKQLVAAARRADPSRAVTVGLYPCRHDAMKWNDKGYSESTPHQFAFYTDVMSVNYMEGFFRRDHPRYPQLKFLVSEMATGELGYGFFNYDHSYTCGQFYWGGTDYIGESFGWPSKGWINGLVYLTNELKPIGQSVRSFYSDKPMVSIGVADEAKAGSKEWNDAKISWKPFRTDWNFRQGDTLQVQVFSNCDETDLVLNGRSLGRKRLPPRDKAPKLVWRVAYEPGELKAVGYNDGRRAAVSVLRSAGAVKRLVLKADADTLRADGLDLCYVNVSLVDGDGNLVTNADRDVAFSVTGAGNNAGVANADITSSERFQADHRSTWHGKCQLVVRAGRKPGMVTVRAKAKGLKPVTVKIKVIHNS